LGANNLDVPTESLSYIVPMLPINWAVFNTDNPGMSIVCRAYSGMSQGISSVSMQMVLGWQPEAMYPG
jgi:hypothetical protein